MKHGVRFPASTRDEIARLALELFERERERARGLDAVQEAFDVSEPTARNLVSHGRYLRRQEKAA